MKICPVGAELFACGWKGGRRDGRTDRQTQRSQKSLFAILRTRLKQLSSVRVSICQHRNVWISLN